jgi:mannose/fructose/N-acetylgalactosamine-specific phosphotransferase system component IID
METHSKKKTKISDYWPLVILIFVALLASLAVGHATHATFMGVMHFFMGFLLCFFSLLKLFNLHGFADGFQLYDMIAKQSRLYALAYPLIELVLGLAYLSFITPQYIYIATIILMTIGAVGVIFALKKGLNTFCACMGSVLQVPLSTVTLIEDISMGLMALYMLVTTLYQ